MKFQRLIAILVIVTALVSSCGSEKNKLETGDKKKQLAEYKTQLKDLTGKIELLERDIAKLDTSFHVAQKTKLITVEALKKQDFKHYID